MKTYLFDTINRYKRLSENLDVKVVLCNKSWIVFNNSGEKETYIFQENGNLIISLNGEVTNATWQYISANKSLIISGNEQSYMVHAAYVDDILFVLQIDGTQNCAFLIDENNKQYFLSQTYNDIKQYFQSKEQNQIQKEKFEQLENKRLYVQEREQEQKKRKIQELQSKANEIKNANIKLCWLIYIICFLVSVWGTQFLASLNISPIFSFLYGLIGGPFVMIGIPFFIIKTIETNKVKEWKRRHPNEQVNQYL